MPHRTFAGLPAMQQVVREWIDAVIPDLGIGLQVETGLKAGARIAPFAEAGQNIMEQRILTGSAHILFRSRYHRVSKSGFGR